jgi:site-specific DNA-cytosine methylase
VTYRVPTMAEIAETPWNSLRAASLFAGCGGSSLGYRMAGFRVVYANDWDDHARRTYALNMAPWTTLDGTNVTDLRAERILEAVNGSGGAELDVLDGSPPCQGFSIAGRRQMDDPRNQLYYEFIRLVREVQPRAFVAENVAGLARGRALGHLVRIIARFKESGYRVRRHLLDASRLGVPQARQRLIIIGFREDLGVDPAEGFPRPSRRQTTINEALPHVGHFGPSMTVTTGGLDARNGSFRVRENGEVVARRLSVDEIKRLCSFPDDFRMEGTPTQRRRRLGNAVPPLMARAWAERLRDVLCGMPGRGQPHVVNLGSHG